MKKLTLLLPISLLLGGCGGGTGSPSYLTELIVILLGVYYFLYIRNKTIEEEREAERVLRESDPDLFVWRRDK